MNNDIEQKNLQELKETVKLFFNNFLNVYEVSDNGHEFFPIYVGCSRCLKLDALNQTLEKMRVLSEANAKPRLNND